MSRSVAASRTGEVLSEEISFVQASPLAAPQYPSLGICIVVELEAVRAERYHCGVPDYASMFS